MNDRQWNLLFVSALLTAGFVLAFVGGCGVRVYPASSVGPACGHVHHHRPHHHATPRFAEPQHPVIDETGRPHLMGHQQFESWLFDVRSQRKQKLERSIHHVPTPIPDPIAINE